MHLNINEIKPPQHKACLAAINRHILVTVFALILAAVPGAADGNA